MLHFLKLIRVQNLLIIVATQCLIRWAVFEPMLKVNELQLQFSNFHFFLLSLSVVLIAAGGYIINDYFDTKTDRVNHPEKVIIGKHISRTTALYLHTSFNIVGVLIGIFISWKVGMWKLVVIHLLSTGLLWFYSTAYKRQLLIGNVIVALLTALVPIQVAIYEILALNGQYALYLQKMETNFLSFFYWSVGFGLFAFLGNMAREIVKDIEDYEGDFASNCTTLPLTFGTKTAKWVAALFVVSIMVCSLFAYFLYIKEIISLVYISVTIVLPCIYIVYSLMKADSQQDYHFTSTLLKILMLFGLGYSLVFRFVVSNNL